VGTASSSRNPKAVIARPRRQQHLCKTRSGNARGRTRLACESFGSGGPNFGGGRGFAAGAIFLRSRLDARSEPDAVQRSKNRLWDSRLRQEMESIRSHTGDTVCHLFGLALEASRAIRQAEVGASQTMLVRTQECFGIWPQCRRRHSLWLSPVRSLARRRGALGRKGDAAHPLV
jgi:hypothetical protein